MSWDQIPPEYRVERRLAAAYHEAGHAAVLYLHGIESHLSRIDMRGNALYAAEVRYRTIRIMPHNVPRVICQCLAGPCAEHRVVSRDQSWLDYELEEWESLGSDPKHDIGIAMRAAGILYGRGRRARRYLEQWAVWTDDLMDHGPCWSAIEKLAGHLAVTDLTTGVKAWRLLEAGWGGEYMPVLGMGYRWRRRFRLKPRLSVAALTFSNVNAQSH